MFDYFSILGNVTGMVKGFFENYEKLYSRRACLARCAHSSI